MTRMCLFLNITLHHNHLLLFTKHLAICILNQNTPLELEMFEFCYLNKCNIITVFKRAFLCFVFMFLISVMICVSKNLRNALSWHRSRWKNSDNRSVGVSRFLLRSNIKARHRVCKREGHYYLAGEMLETIYNNKQWYKCSRAYYKLIEKIAYI